MTTKMLGRACLWRSGCHCWDCCGNGGGRARKAQRQKEKLAWRNEQW